MDSVSKFLDVMKKAIVPPANTLFIVVEIKEITGETCTVMYGELELTDVRLKATINGNSNKLLVLPKVGSMAVIGSLTGGLHDMAVMAVDEVEKLVMEQDGFKLEIDTATGKFLIENQLVGLKTLLQDLVNLLKQLQVFTPSGPSGTPLPNTIAALTQFETDFKKLLK